jgi:uncharacterized protein (TIGR03435 family)
MCRLATSLLVSTLGVFAQPSDPATFEVASLRSVSNETGSGIGRIQGGPGTDDPERFRCANISLFQLVRKAYNVREAQIQGPKWFADNSPHFDLVAKVPRGAKVGELNLMLQNLLAERFLLKSHQEAKELPDYRLRIAKSGLKLIEAPADSLPAFVSLFPLPDGYRLDAGGAVTVAQMAAALEPRLSAPVLDETGLTARYTLPLRVRFSREEVPSVDSLFPGIATVLEHDLGLKLEKGKDSFDVIVVDHVEKIPTEN